jgi:hypothetical protein
MLDYKYSCFLIWLLWTICFCARYRGTLRDIRDLSLADELGTSRAAKQGFRVYLSQVCVVVVAWAVFLQF